MPVYDQEYTPRIFTVGLFCLGPFLTMVKRLKKCVVVLSVAVLYINRILLLNRTIFGALNVYRPLAFLPWPSPRSSAHAVYLIMAMALIN